MFQTTDSIMSILSSKNIVVFDWDDTLFPTTWLTKEGCIECDNTQNWPDEPMVKLTDEIQTKLQKFETMLFNFFNKIYSYDCEIYIITNSKNGWVESSCDACFPRLKQFVDKIQVISARPLECDNFMNTKWMTWKELKFNSCFKNLFQFPLDLITKHIISIGDSIAELNAATNLGKYKDRTFIKTVKMCETPSLSQLEDQYTFLISCFEYILHINKHLNVKLFGDSIEIFASNSLC